MGHCGQTPCGAVVPKLTLLGTLLVVIAACAPALAGSADPYERCRRAKLASEKIEYCSLVIRDSRNPTILERAYNRRGLAYMEVNRFADAARDFTSVINLNPKIPAITTIGKMH